jgi:death-on-curing protein
MPWVWVEQAIVLAIHEEQIAEHGGGSGLRDEGLLGSALARPVNKASYENANAADLAGAYGFGLARNHPFVDGNKRTALVVTELFLNLNGFQLDADDAACLRTFLSLAEGSLSEDDLVEWIRSNIRPEV